MNNKEFLKNFGIFAENNRSIAMRGDKTGKRNMAPPINKRKDNLIGKVITI